MEKTNFSARVIESQCDGLGALKSGGRIDMLMFFIGIIVNRIRTFMQSMYDEAGRL